MQAIGFKNFRRFKELNPLELSGITFFVGGNNAGKSTVVKAMMLMLDNLKHVSHRQGKLFDVPSFRLDAHHIHELHIGTFGRSLHRPFPEDMMFSIEVQIENQKIRYTVTGDVDSSQPIADIVKIEVENLQDKTKYLFDFLSHQTKVCYNTSVLNRFVSSADENSNEEESLRTLLSDLEAQRDTLVDQINGSSDPLQVARANNELSALEEKIKALAKSSKQQIEDVEVEFPLSTFIESSLDGYLNMLMAGLSTYFSSTTMKGKARSKWPKKDRAFINMIDSEAEQLSETVFAYFIVYIPAHAATQKTVFSVEDKNDYMAGILREFMQCRIKQGGREDLFIMNWMKELKIGLGYEIVPFSGEAYTVNVINMSGETVPLADLGMGSIQMMMLLLKLATIINTKAGNNTMVIVEEPEQNIHPKLQSKLAELFEHVHREYGFRFLVETHSEYMIRKTQAMIATEAVSFENNPFRVYYFPENGTPYDMVYQLSGMFENKFDEGFFDEASKQQFSVIKKAREIQHV